MFSRLVRGAISQSRSALRARPLSSASTRSFQSSPSLLHDMPTSIAGADKSSLMFSISHKPGSLQQALSYFWKHDINLTRIESRPSVKGKDFQFYVSFQGRLEDKNIKGLLAELEACDSVGHVHAIDSKKVPWFPTRVQDVDEFANQVLDAGDDLESDHPGFNDPEYRARRGELAEIAQTYSYGEEIPHIQYTENEIKTWGEVYKKLRPLVDTFGCREHKELMPLLEQNCGYAVDNIPQVADISRFMKARTGFVLRPVAGLLSARNFLYGLAFRVFFSTQYIRHHSKPLYTPEPDICHELMGHAPLFADPEFADFSQEIGLASIGATDDQILQLARCYWFSVEFGLCEEDGDRKAYGAGLLSSFGELEYSMSDEPQILPWDPFDASQREYPITTYQPVYYLAKNFSDAKDKMKEFAESFSRPFNVHYNEETQTIEVDRNLTLLQKPGKKAK